MLKKTLFKTLTNTFKKQFCHEAVITQALTQNDPIIQLPITSIVYTGNNSKIINLGLKKNQQIGLQPGQYIYIHQELQGEPIKRAYTPITETQTTRNCSICLKVLDNGRLTPFIDSLKAGDRLTVSGPHGKYLYKGEGTFQFLKEQREKTFKKFVMIAQSAGVTPLIQIMQYINFHREMIPIDVIVGNKSMKDILMLPRLKKLNDDLNNRINVTLTVDKDGDKEEGIRTGAITPELLQELLPVSDGQTGVVFSGSPSMNNTVVETLHKMGYNYDDFIKY